MAKNLVFLTGASSGIGLALAKAVPFEDARIIDIGRRGAEGCEHFAADLADPASWRGVAQLFMREIQGFAGDRVVFIHCAGTLRPMGFAGEVEDEAYARNVLLNSAAPQVLGDAFLRALRRSDASGHLVMISSGAAHSVYEGWTSYGAGKAAVDQWVRAAGAEQVRRGNHCRVLSVAPGIVATAMQEQIREASADVFPEVAKFADLHEAGELREPATVAREIWDLLDLDLENGAVVDLRDLAHA
jgi:NAD(P)-dependent dehydrogenase (short-subunit alcohol dehydrogenase family)